MKNAALSILCIGFLSLASGLHAPLHASPGRLQKIADQKKTILFKRFHGAVEVEGHRTSGIPGMTNYVETIRGTIAFEGINDIVSKSSGNLTYGMSGWNKNDTIPCGICLHKVSGTVNASFESPVSIMVNAANAKKSLTDEQIKQFKDADFFLSALANFEFKITSYTTDCCGKVIPMPPGTYIQTIAPLVIPGNFVPYKFTATIDGWSGDLFFTIKSFDGRSK